MLSLKPFMCTSVFRDGEGRGVWIHFCLCVSAAIQMLWNSAGVISCHFGISTHYTLADQLSVGEKSGNKLVHKVWCWNLTSLMSWADQVWQVALQRRRRRKRREVVDVGSLLSGRLPCEVFPAAVRWMLSLIDQLDRSRKHQENV